MTSACMRQRSRGAEQVPAQLLIRRPPCRRLETQGEHSSPEELSAGIRQELPWLRLIFNMREPISQVGRQGRQGSPSRSGCMPPEPPLAARPRAIWLHLPALSRRRRLLLRPIPCMTDHQRARARPGPPGAPKEAAVLVQAHANRGARRRVLPAASEPRHRQHARVRAAPPGGQIERLQRLAGCLARALAAGPAAHHPGTLAGSLVQACAWHAKGQLAGPHERSAPARAHACPPCPFRPCPRSMRT